MTLQQIERFKNRLIKMDLGEYTNMGSNEYEILHIHISTKNDLSMWIAYTSLGDFKVSYIKKDVQKKSSSMFMSGNSKDSADLYDKNIKRFKTKTQKAVIEIINKAISL